MTNPSSSPHLFPLPPTIFPLTSSAKCKLLKGRGQILLVHSNSLCAQACSNLTLNKCQIKYSNIYWATRQRGREETAQCSGSQTSSVHVRFEQPDLVISQREILNKIGTHNQWRENHFLHLFLGICVLKSAVTWEVKKLPGCNPQVRLSSFQLDLTKSIGSVKQRAFHYDKTCRKPVFPSGWITLFQPLHLGSLRTATWWRKPKGFQCGDLETSEGGIGKVCLRAPPWAGLGSASRRPCESGSLLETPVTPACTTDASWVLRSCQRPSWLFTVPEQATCEKSQRCCDAHVRSLYTHFCLDGVWGRATLPFSASSVPGNASRWTTLSTRKQREFWF